MVHRRLLPQGQRNQQHHDQSQLQQTNHPITPMPRIMTRQTPRHHHRPDGRAHAPKTMQPAHMLGRIMVRHIIIQRCIDRTRAQTQRYRQHAQQGKMMRQRKTQQRQSRHQHTDQSDSPHAEPTNQPITQHAGDNRPSGNDHRNHPRPRNRHTQANVHRRPCRADHRIRQTQADKSHINNEQQNTGNHGSCFLKTTEIKPSGCTAKALTNPRSFNQQP